ncbi:MAG: DUF1365 domain-containing protein [Bryobacteraceae bacterium]
MIPESGLYTGTLRHRRFTPRAHEFRYKLFMAFLDIDKIPELMDATPWTGYNRFRWASFHEKDHLGDVGYTLRERVSRDALRQGITLPDGPIFLLTHLRYLGYCFNPISFFYCYTRSGELDTILAEVNSTFGESRNYWLSPRNQEASENSLRYRCAKTMHVSPFMDMNLDYEFVLTKPGDKLVAHMNTVENSSALRSSQPLLDATLTLDREPWNAYTVGPALARHPWMTAKVIGAIHWEALRLYLKRVPVFTHPDRIRPTVQEATKRT